VAQATIDRLIINSPYEEPARYWKYERETRLFDLTAGRRPAGYVIASGNSKAFDDPGIFVEIPLVNRIRPTQVREHARAGNQGLGQRSEPDQTPIFDEWTRAVNEHGGFGRWSWDVSLDPSDIKDILVRHAQPKAA